jgi:mannonate dehydratase
MKERIMTNKIRLTIGVFRDLIEEDLRFVKQLGADGIIINTPMLTGKPFSNLEANIAKGKHYWTKDEPPTHWEFMELLRLRTKVEDFGLKLEAIENTPPHFYDKAMLGLTGRDEQIENYQKTIQNMGKAGISILGYHWMPNFVWRTSSTTPWRGGSRVASFDFNLVAEAPLTHGRKITHEEMWANYEYFIKAVLPVAEESGVKLALHPDDPPVESLGGIARIMRNFEGFKKAMELADSANHGLDFCLGTWSSMGANIIEAIRYFGSQNKILYMHFRDSKGIIPKFSECFLGEGNTNLFEVLRVLKEVGFNGFLNDDHVPIIEGDTHWRHRSRAYATGYISGLLQALDNIAISDLAPK